MRGRRRASTAAECALLENVLEVREAQLGTDVTGPYWVLATVRLVGQSVRYLHGSTAVEVGGPSYAVFMPPFSLVQVRVSASSIRTHALVSRHELPAEVPREPTVYLDAPRRPARTVQEALAFLRGAAPGVPVSREADPSPLSRRIKRALDRGYRTPGTLIDLAQRMSLSPAVFSRTFKRGYGMPPVRYRHYLRVTEAMLMLLQGDDIQQTSLEVGFSDLGRFYRNFRRLACQPPGWYRRRSRPRRPK